ncbi:hypothetical protein LLG39_12975, partial [bacterium]|nr:hypothetical protein [bacterium]
DIAIDILYIDFEGRQLTEMKKWQLEGELVTVLSGQLSIDALLQKWGKKISTKPSVTSLRVLDNLSDHQTVVEVRATDIPGVLYYLTRKISEQGMNIHSARVATWGHEARDAFYLTNSAGDLLDDENIETLRAAL